MRANTFIVIIISMDSDDERTHELGSNYMKGS
jgi:hypothetical protein